jgi:dolichyl-phosphate-mannose-protein mannosyltransferase
MKQIVHLIKQLLRRFLAWEYAVLCLLVLLVLALHLAAILRPDAPVFDEQYYVPDARSILRGDGSERIEHPPLGKLIIAGGLAIFGDNPFGWRIMSVLFGLACIVFFYLICRKLALSKRASFLTTFILALENLSFVQAGVAMLDVFSLAFMLMAFWLYLRKQNALAGVSVGLAALVKLTGALALPVIVLHWVLTSRKDAWRFSISMLAAPAVFFVLMPVLDLISPSLWALIIPVMLYAFYKAFKRNTAAIFSTAWFTCLYLLWIPFSIISDRISYVYYFYPVVGAVCLAMGVWADGVFNRRETGHMAWLERWAVPAFVLAHLAAFAVLAPVSYWWKVPCCVMLYILVSYQMAETSSPVSRHPD